jgi:hypothetical protein
MIRRILLLLVAGLAIAAVVSRCPRPRGRAVREGDLSEAPRSARRPLGPRGRVEPCRSASSCPPPPWPTRSTARCPRITASPGRQRVCVDAAPRCAIRSGQVGGDLGRLLGDLAGRSRATPRARASGALPGRRLRRDHPQGGAAGGSRTGRGLEVVLPIAVEGRAGVPGELARALGFDSRSFRGAIEAVARVSADLDRNWCPRLTARATSAGSTARSSRSWTATGSTWTAGGLRAPPPDRAGHRGARRARDLRHGARRHRAEWRENGVALPIPQADEDLAHLFVRPDRRRLLRHRLRGRGHFCSDPHRRRDRTAHRARRPRRRRLELPPLERIGARANTVDINLPVRLGYDSLAAELNRQLAGRDLHRPDPGGRGAGDRRGGHGLPVGRPARHGRALHRRPRLPRAQRLGLGLSRGAAGPVGGRAHDPPRGRGADAAGGQRAVVAPVGPLQRPDRGPIARSAVFPLDAPLGRRRTGSPPRLATSRPRPASA